MYRYSVDNAVTYTPDDLTLFRESPFAAWMERLTLENPDHGIPCDRDSVAPGGKPAQGDDLAESLRAEGRDVVLIDTSEEESRRRADTLDAMRAGTDFIIHGTLALGPLSGTAPMLMRTSGYSDLGDFLYIPCCSQADSALDVAFRLCFLADLLHSLQGQLPPQLLVIRSDADVLPLQTEDHIHYYRAVKARFLAAMQDFRKHRMPDPAVSSHFGRWSECAGEVLKQRAQRTGQQQQSAEELDVEEAQFTEEPLAAEESLAAEEALAAEAPLAAAASGGMARSARAFGGRGAALDSRARDGGGPTLLEQARSLAPDAFKNRAAPGRTPNLAHFPISETRPPPRERAVGDEALQNLAFIGSNLPSAPSAGGGEPAPDARSRDDAAHETVEALHPAPAGGGDSAPEPPVSDATPVRPAPPPNLREVVLPEPVIEGYDVELIDFETFDKESREPLLLPPDRTWASLRRRELQNVDSDRPARSSVVDLDGAPSPKLAPLAGGRGGDEARGRDTRRDGAVTPGQHPTRPFSDSLITNENYGDNYDDNYDGNHDEN